MKALFVAKMPTGQLVRFGLCRAPPILWLQTGRDWMQVPLSLKCMAWDARCFEPLCA